VAWVRGQLPAILAVVAGSIPASVQGSERGGELPAVLRGEGTLLALVVHLDASKLCGGVVELLVSARVCGGVVVRIGVRCRV
jgi:hypothetical protein